MFVNGEKYNKDYVDVHKRHKASLLSDKPDEEVREKLQSWLFREGKVVTETHFSVCTFVWTCASRVSVNALNQGPRVLGFVAEEK